MSIRVMSQGLVRLLDAFGQGEYQRGVAERAAKHEVPNPRVRLYEAIVALEARNAELEAENAHLRLLLAPTPAEPFDAA